MFSSFERDSADGELGEACGKFAGEVHNKQQLNSSAAPDADIHPGGNWRKIPETRG